ncbi:hypothetical protein FOYG_06864 [Fusarium oxysporum NRRL 32931]|uniref:SCP domain-containing protein n=1 Tax=Fusarium oxysporum NRRL 32931 TaxID=660029 RepID=W9IMA1_FUSOX|nr:hypothetical protein FOYG_06864 [Fusarium oxysporum NRRL 32931]
MRLTTLGASLCCMDFRPGDSVIESQDIVHGLLRLNSARNSNGYRPLIWDPALASNAQDYAIQLGCGAVAPGKPERTAVYKEISATCAGQSHRLTFETAANFWLTANYRPNRVPEDYYNYRECMGPEAGRVGCGQSYDHENHCVFYTVCMFSSHRDCVNA